MFISVSALGAAIASAPIVLKAIGFYNLARGWMGWFWSFIPEPVRSKVVTVLILALLVTTAYYKGRWDKGAEHAQIVRQAIDRNQKLTRQIDDMTAARLARNAAIEEGNDNAEKAARTNRDSKLFGDRWVSRFDSLR